MNWFYKDIKINNLDDILALNDFNPYGFIYQIYYENYKTYIGKKALYKRYKLPALKNGKQRPNSERIGKNVKGKRVYYDIVRKESNWFDYVGSVDTDLEPIHKEILCFARTKRELTYLEIKEQFKHNVLEDELYINNNINGLWFKGNLV